MNDATDVTKSAIENEMSVGIRTGLQIALDDFSGIERNDDHVPGPHGGVWDARRFDDDVPTCAVNAADIAPGLDDKALCYELKVGRADLFLESFEHLRFQIPNH